VPPLLEELNMFPSTSLMPVEPEPTPRRTKPSTNAIARPT
jgi:hypothetical protein